MFKETIKNFMRFKINYSKTANELFFITNLSEWSYFCRKHYNKEWIGKSALTKKEKVALTKIGQILNINPGLYKVLWGIENEIIPREEVSKMIGEAGLQNLYHAIKILSPRFEKIWKNEQKNLQNIQQNLSATLKPSHKIFKLISSLYQSKCTQQEIKIMLLMSPIKKRLVGGGSGLENNKITIECSKMTETNNKKGMLQRVIIHEITHICFEQRLRKKIEAYQKSNAFTKKYRGFLETSEIYKKVPFVTTILKEIILTSLIPEGYLAEKFFDDDVIKNIKKRKCIKERKLQKIYSDLMLYCTCKMYDMAKSYTQKKKPLDKNFIESAMNHWVEFEKIDLGLFVCK